MASYKAEPGMKMNITVCSSQCLILHPSHLILSFSVPEETFECTVSGLSQKVPSVPLKIISLRHQHLAVDSDTGARLKLEDDLAFFINDCIFRAEVLEVVISCVTKMMTRLSVRSFIASSQIVRASVDPPAGRPPGDQGPRLVSSNKTIFGITNQRGARFRRGAHATRQFRRHLSIASSN